MGHRDILPGGPPAELTQQRHAVVVFACGDPAHGEHDSVAIAAASGLQPALLERVDLKLTGPMRPEYLRDLAPGTQVVIADTVPGSPGAPATPEAATSPGPIVEVTFLELQGREEVFVTSATADPPLDEVVAMAQLLRDTPLPGRFIGLAIEATSEDLRAETDPAAVNRLRAAIERAIDELGGVT